jgi:hypothetical protein
LQKEVKRISDTKGLWQANLTKGQICGIIKQRISGVGEDEELAFLLVLLLKRLKQAIWHGARVALGLQPYNLARGNQPLESGLLRPRQTPSPALASCHTHKAFPI